MIIYRPHRGGLAESMAEAREFESVEAMKGYLVRKHNIVPGYGPPFDAKDIIVGGTDGEDFHIGWKDVSRVCVKCYYDEDYEKPQCIGYCSTDYGSMEQSQRMCKEFLEGKQ